MTVGDVVTEETMYCFCGGTPNFFFGGGGGHKQNDRRKEQRKISDPLLLTEVPGSRFSFKWVDRISGSSGKRVGEYITLKGDFFPLVYST
jgi:hypothetical protein